MRRPSFLIIVAIGASMWTLLGGALTAGAGTTPEFLPNIRPLAPDQLSISTSNGHRQLNFAFSPEDIGTGPLELQPQREDCNGDGNSKNDRTAYQNVYGDTNANGVYDWPNTTNPLGADAVVSSTLVGCFAFDPDHGHWHFANYAKYRLLTLTGRVVGKRTKVGFCLIDHHQVDILPGTPDNGHRYYSNCDDLHIQGISVGWADVYNAFIPGQSIVIDGVANGRYCLVERADPHRQLQESDATDNQARLKIRIQGTGVQALPNPC
jgi:hypothetical protein